MLVIVDRVDDLESLLEVDFESALPPESVFAEAWADPAARAALSDANLGEKLAANGVRAFRYVTARVGTTVGVPFALVGDFAAAISSSGAEQAIAKWGQFVSSAADAAIDIACQAMGAVPFVGWLAKGIKAILDVIALRLARGQPRPALLSYSLDDDQYYARELLRHTRGLDWTAMFLPVSDPQSWGSWKATKASDGWLLAPAPKFDRGGDAWVGCVPGGVFGTRGVQVRNCWNPPTLSPTGAGGIQAGQKNNLERLREAFRDDFAAATACLAELYDARPSVSRVALTAWQQMTATRTATMFCVDTRPLADAWDTYVATALEASRVHTDAEVGQFGASSWLAWRNLGAAMYVRGWKIGKGPRRTATFADVARSYSDDLRKRQRAALDTVLVAYAQEAQGAFRDPGLRELLTRRRAQLLTAPERWALREEDILDPDFRLAWRESVRNPGDRPLAVEPRVPKRVPPALPLPTPEGAGAVEGAGGAWVLGALGLAAVGGAAWYASRRQ